jgi:acyl-coenzyme A thioesterase PaaI-like protein
MVMKEGLDSMDAIAAAKRKWGAISFMRAQGLEVREHAIGEVILRLPLANEAQRGGGGSGDGGESDVLNGGVVAYMFDGALGFSITSALLALPDARRIDLARLRQFTINLDITYLDAARGASFEAHGKAVRVSRSTAFAEGWLRDADGKVCATARGIWRIFWPGE